MPTKCCANCKYVTDMLICTRTNRRMKVMSKCDDYKCFAEAKQFKPTKKKENTK